MSSAFGDFTPDDAYSTDRADAEAVARWIRWRFGKRAKASDVNVIRELLDHLRREGSG